MKKLCLLLCLLLAAIQLFACESIDHGDRQNDTNPSDMTGVSTNGEETTHEHIYRATIVAPTCTKGGYTVHTCTECGESYTDEHVAKLGHTWSEWTIKTAATLTKNGTATRKCTVCGITDTKAISAEWNESALKSGLVYEKDNHGYTFVRLVTANASVIRIPSVTSTGEVVSGIRSDAFRNSVVTEIQLPDTIEVIEKKAFANCPNLTSLTIPESVTTIYSGIVDNCPKLKTVFFNAKDANCYSEGGWGDLFAFTQSSVETVFFGDNVQAVPEGLFKGCATLVRAELGKNTKTIRSYAFQNAASFTTIVWNQKLETIGDGAFQGSSIIDFHFPNSLKEIGSSAFRIMPEINLEELTLGENLKSLGSNCFSRKGRVGRLTILSGSIETVDVMNEVYGPFCGLTVESVYFDDRVVGLGEYFLGGVRGLCTVTLGAGMRTVGEALFKGCVDLETVTLHENTVAIGDSAFSGCTELREITGFEHVTTIGIYAFENCAKITEANLSHLKSLSRGAYAGSGLTSVILSDDLKILPVGLFADCKNLKTITLPEGLTTIEGDVFYASGLRSLTIPDSVTSFGGYVFRYCKDLETVVFSKNIPSIGDFTFEGCYALTSVMLPEKLTSLGYSTFFRCTALESLTIPNGVTSVNYNCFYGCSALKTLILPDGMLEISPWAFFECSSLSSVYLGNSLTKIGADVFMNCTALATIWLPRSLASMKVYGNSKVFSGCNVIVYTDAESLPTEISSYLGNPKCGYTYEAYLTEILE